MGVYKRGRTYWFSLMCNGRRVRRSAGTENRKLAESIYMKAKTLVAEAKWFDLAEARLHTFDEMIDRYLKEHSAVNKAPGSYRNDLGYADRLKAAFGSLTLDKITPRLINEYKGQRIEAGASAATIAKELIFIGHAFNIAVREWQWTSTNPLDHVKKPSVRNQVERWLTKDEEVRLLRACHDREWLRNVVVFALNTGMRQSEIVNLTWKDVDLFRRAVTLLKTKNKEKRTIPLCKAAVDLLKGMSRAVHMSGYVFTQRGGKLTKREIQRQFETALARAGIEDFRFHDLRHTFATRMVQSGVDIYAVSRLLGHKTIRMTERYAHHCPESLRRAVETLDSLTDSGAELLQSVTNQSH